MFSRLEEQNQIEQQRNSSLDPILTSILQIEEKYEYINKLVELKQLIDEFIKKYSESHVGNDFDKSNINLLTKISDIIEVIETPLKQFAPEQVKTIYQNLNLIINKIFQNLEEKENDNTNRLLK